MPCQTICFTKAERHRFLQFFSHWQINKKVIRLADCTQYAASHETSLLQLIQTHPNDMQDLENQHSISISSIIIMKDFQWSSRDRASWKRLFTVGLKYFPVLIVIVELFSDRIFIFTWS